MHQVIGQCPICSGELQVTRLHCPACDTAVEGSFTLSGIYGLSREQMQFVEIFLKNRGSLKDVGQELSISYPTVVSRLNDVLVAMGFADRVKPADEATATPDQRRDILERLARGELSADDAARQLRGKITVDRSSATQ
jgi:hypothetical protein